VAIKERQTEPIKFDSPGVNIKKTFQLLAAITLIGASLQSLFQRVVWTSFALTLIYAADKLKDIERAKQKERDETEIRMEKARLQGWKDSLGEQQTFLTEQLAKGNQAVLGQVSTYVKDVSPTRAAELHVVNEGDK
jgi:hypothetical protein